MGPLRSSLEREWEATATRAEATRALRRWAATEPVLAPFVSLTAVLEAVQRPGASRASNDILAALLRVGDGEPLARRCVLQALVPVLVSMARRYPGEGDHEDRFQEVLVLSVERIHSLAGGDVSWPATAIAGHVRDRLRRAASHGRPHLAALEDAPEIPAGPERSAAEQLAGAVLDSFRSGALRRDEAALLYATRVIGHPSARVAAALGMDADVLRSRRNRAETRLIESQRAVC
jgi:DNA-directed RNA polymerase specialized sigma24 family protein